MENRILLVALGLLSIVVMGALSGCFFFESIEEERGTVKTLNVDIDLDAGTDTASITSLSGTVIWTDYLVLIDQVEFTTTTMESSAGLEVIFTDPLGGLDMVPGQSYNIKIVNIEDNAVTYENDIIAKMS